MGARVGQGHARGAGVAATAEERAAVLPGDEIVPRADVVMDRGFTLPGAPEAVWPWFVQLGKNRAGWYLPRSVERFLPPGRRALRRVDESLQHLQVGDVIADWGGPEASFETMVATRPEVLVYRSTRGGMQASWAIVLTPARGTATRTQLRLRLGPVHRIWLTRTGGGLLDWVTIAGLAAGLRERLAPPG
jgi:hypothetical protein